MQVAGPYDLLGAIRRALPKSLKILDGESVSLEWYLADELPTTKPASTGKPLAYPNGIFRILPPIQIKSAVSADANVPYRMEPTNKSEPLTFTTGVLTYLVAEQDIIGVTSVTGTLSGVAGHVFVANTDYTFTVDSIVWTGTGNVPDNGTVFTSIYQHRMYYPRRVMDSRVTVRAILRCQQYIAVSREYPMSTLAAVLGSSLEMQLRSQAANRMIRPATTDEPYTETITMGRVLSAGPLPMDNSGSVAAWFVDFTLNIGGIFEDSAVQSILDVPYEVDLVP